MSPPKSSPPLPLRTRGALAVGRLAATASRPAGRGQGGVVGGTVALRLDRDALPTPRPRPHDRARLGQQRQEHDGGAPRRGGEPARADRLQRERLEHGLGLVVALEAARDAPYAVLETDESYLGPVTQATRPRAIALLNLSRDYLERGVRYKPLARHWRETLEQVDWPLTVIANADDPIVTWAARPAQDVVWVAGGDEWSEDGAICRDCIVAAPAARASAGGASPAARSGRSRAGGSSATWRKAPGSRCRSSSRYRAHEPP